MFGARSFVLPLAVVLAFALALTAGAQEPGSDLKQAFTPPSLPAGVDPEDLPRAGERGAQELDEALEREKARVESRKRELASAGAREARERSRTEHLGASDVAAAMLARQEFGDLLNGAAAGLVFADTALGREVQRFVDDYTMVLEGNGEEPPVLVESPWPVWAVADDGRKRAVDLSLEPIKGGLKPVNAASDIKLPASLSDGVELGEIAVVPAGTADAQVAEDGAGHAVYANAEVDTDVIVTPLATGIELFWQLRSPRASEQMAFDLELPEGAIAEAGKGNSVIVSRDGKALAVVRPPMAVDAQGQDVPVEMGVAGTRVTLSVPHREKDLAYPILVDPVIEDYWVNTGSWMDQDDWALEKLGDWLWSGTNMTAAHPSQHCRTQFHLVCNAEAGRPWYDPSLPDGLHIYLPYNVTYPAGAYAEWVYLPPGTTTRVQEAYFYGFYNRRFGNDHPYMYTGIWSTGANTWAGTPGTYTQSFGPLTLPHFGGGTTGPQKVVFGFRTGINISNPTWRDGYAGAAILALTDPEAPAVTGGTIKRRERLENGTFGWVSHSTATDWVKPQDELAMHVHATDPGLGVRQVNLTGPGGVNQTNNSGCAGHKSDPCYATWPDAEWAWVDLDVAGMPDGTNAMSAKAWDALGHESSAGSFSIKVDSVRPTIDDTTTDGDASDVTGSLWAAREQESLPPESQPVLSPGSHPISFTAADPGTSTTASGIKKVTIKVDGVVEQENTAGCSGPCSQSISWNYNTTQFLGRHKISLCAVDKADGEYCRTFFVNAVATGDLIYPADGEITSSKIALQAKDNDDDFTGVRFEYRRRLFGGWTTINSYLTDDQGTPISATTHPLTEPGRHSKKLIWDVRAVLGGLVPAETSIQVRAVFTIGGQEFKSRVSDVDLDVKGLSADNASTGIGPGSVDLLTGNFNYSATDASLSSFGAPIALTRTFNSLEPDINPNGPFGPGWVSSAPLSGVSDYSSLVVLTDPATRDWVDVFDSAGQRIRFEKTGETTFKAQPGFEALKLTRVVTSAQPDKYVLADLDGVTTTFVTLPTTSKFVPSKVDQPGSQGTASYSYAAYQNEPRLKRVVAPSPPSVNCDQPNVEAQSLPLGCRVLQLNYQSFPSFGGERLTSIQQFASDGTQMVPNTLAQFSYFADGRLSEAWDPRISPALKETYTYTTWHRIATIAPPGEAPWSISYMSDPAHPNKLDTISRTADGSGAASWRMRYQVPLSTSAGGPYNLTGTVPATWGQTDRPIDATTILPPTETGTGYSKATISYLNQDGRVVNTAGPGGRISVAEYDPKGNVVRELSAANRAKAVADGGDTALHAGLLSTYRTYSSNGLRLIEELGPEHEVKLDSGQVVDARAHTVTTYDEGYTPPQQGPAQLHLPTTAQTGAQVDPSDPDVDVRTVKTEYDWTLRKPTRTIVDAGSGALNITRQTDYNTAGLETASRQPKSNGSDAGATQTLYYTADASSPDAVCRNKIEWFNLPCKTMPAAQPGTPGVPDLPTTTYAYNRFGQVTTATETVAAVTRTTTTTYDSAGRQLSSLVSSTDLPVGGLVGALGFEEESGTSVVDSSTQGNNGTIENASRSDEGRFGRAIRFDGVGDLVRVTDSASLDLTGQMTLEAWVRPDMAALGNFAQIISKAGTGTPCPYSMYSLRLATGNHQMPIPTGDRCSALSFAVPSPTQHEAWNHLALTVDGSNQARLYVGGVQVATTPFGASAATNAADLLFGPDFKGLIDEVRIYGRALSSQDIEQDMRAPIDPDAVGEIAAPEPQMGLLGAFGFEDDPSSQTVTDSSGSGGDGELGSAARSVGGRHGDAVTTSDGMVTVPDYGGLLSLYGPMTIDAWVGLEHDYDPYSDPSGVIAGKADAYVLRINGDGDAEFAIDPYGTGTFIPEYTAVATDSTLFETERMVHVTGTYDGATLRVYLNGELAGETYAYSGPPGGSEPFTIGGSNYESPLAATIDEVRVYDRELSPSEIAQDATTPIALPIAGEPSASVPAGGSYPVATTTYGYSSTTGRPTTVSTPTTTTATAYDNIGRQISYTDADGATSTTSYDNLNQPVTTSDGKGTQTRSYDSTTAALTSLVDSHAGTFTASYDADGRIASKTYPNGMKADTTYDPSGSPVALKYTKTSNCSSNCVWIDEQVKESIHGQWRTHSWELSSQEYTYDKAGRLTRVEDDVQSPAAVAGCTIRSYAFDANSNRTSMNTKAPAGNGDCQPGAAGTSKTYSYDDADRLTGTGITYDKFGRMTNIPAQHSGGGVLTYTYYANEQVRTVSQDGVSKTYSLDPTGRQRQTVANGGTTYTETLHYQDGSDSPSWTRVANAQGVETSWDRNIEGIDGDLAAIRTHNAQGDTTILQLQNLHGDIIATASTDSNATALTARFESDEFGNPRQPGGADKRYGWLGGKQRRTELASGVIQMGVRSYVPALGRFTGVDPVRGGSASSYDYSSADPVNKMDLTGAAWTYSRYRATYTDTWALRAGGKVIARYLIEFRVSLDGRNVWVKASAKRISGASKYKVSSRTVECFEVHAITYESCGTRDPTRPERRTRNGRFNHFYLSQDEDYKIEFRHRVAGHASFLRTRTFTCRSGRKGDRACEF